MRNKLKSTRAQSNVSILHLKLNSVYPMQKIQILNKFNKIIRKSNSLIK